MCLAVSRVLFHLQLMKKLNWKQISNHIFGNVWVVIFKNLSGDVDVNDEELKNLGYWKHNSIQCNNTVVVVGGSCMHDHDVS